MKNIINWKVFFILLIACVLTALMVIPFSLALTATEVDITPLMLILTFAQNLVMFAVVIFLGLLLSKKIGMGLPILSNVLEGKNQTKEIKSILLPSIVLGLAAGVLIVLLALLFNIPELNNSESSISPWKALLASFYGGIGEEVLLRLFLVSLFVWITFKIKKNEDGMPTNFGIWLSILLSAIVFGLGHLPATAQIVPLTGIIILRAVVLNGAGGIIFGWLYWKKGLESAMIAHFSADTVLHIITPCIMVLFLS